MHKRNLFIFFILFLINCFNSSENLLIKPILEKGFIDLSNYNFSTNEPVNLNGIWKFYWNELLSPNEESKNDSSKSYIKVPMAWNDYIVSEKKVGGLGYATYRLNIRVNQSEIGKILSVKIPHVGTAYKFWINDELFAENGIVGTSFQTMYPQYRNILKSFIVKKEELVFTIQISNFHHRKGGIRFESLLIGSEEKILNIQSGRNLYTFFLMGSLVIMSIYHFGLFFLRKEDFAALVFGIFCLLISIRMTLIGDIWITYMFPNFDWNWNLKLEYLTLYLSAPTFVSFIRFVFKDEFPKKLYFSFISIHAIFVFFILVSRPIIFSQSLIYFQIFALANALFLIFVISFAAYNRKEGAIAALIGFIIFILAIINDLLFNNEIIITGYGNLIPLSVFLFIFSQSFILSQIFANAFKSIKTLSNNLTLTNAAYSRFVPVEFLKFLNRESIIDIQLGDQIQKEMAILFSDIRSFTELSEKMSPKENFNFLNSYLKRMNPAIQKNNGFIDKYIGDAIMALFPNKVEDAINAGIEMQKEIRLYNQHRLKTGYDPIKVGCGIHLGNLMLGIIGADARMEGTVIADSVNVASRIEGLTKVYDASILVSDVILKRIENLSQYNYRYIDKTKVKGKSNSIVIYEIYDGQAQYNIDMKNNSKSLFEEGISLYHENNFTDCIELFEKALEISPKDLAIQIYLKRAKYFKEHGVLEEDE